MKAESGERKAESGKQECKMQIADCRLQIAECLATRHWPLATGHWPLPGVSRLLIDPPQDGPWNMAVDETMLEAADRGGCTLRFYQWEQPTLSLGYFQTYADRWQHEPSRRCAVVRRASGGGAILHDVEVTYSLAIAASHPAATNRLRLYEMIHAALIDALTDWGIRATLHMPLERIARDAPRAKEPFLCFQRRAAGDVLLEGVKVAGSAQRRCRGAVLQHGSVLLGRTSAAPELPGINDLSGQCVDPGQLIEAWLDRLVRPRNSEQIQALGKEERNRVAELVDTKYGASAWTENRNR